MPRQQIGGRPGLSARRRRTEKLNRPDHSQHLAQTVSISISCVFVQKVDEQLQAFRAGTRTGCTSGPVAFTLHIRHIEDTLRLASRAGDTRDAERRPRLFLRQQLVAGTINCRLDDGRERQDQTFTPAGGRLSYAKTLKPHSSICWRSRPFAALRPFDDDPFAGEAGRSIRFFFPTPRASARPHPAPRYPDTAPTRQNHDDETTRGSVRCARR